MRRVILIALLAIMAVALTACGSGTKEVTSATNNAKVFTTGTPTKEIPSVKWYTFYRGVLGLVAATWVDYPELMVNANLCESIVRAQPDYSIVPGLANFVVSDDYKTYTYTLRDGAAFWNGAPVTAQDVLFSIKANTTPPFGGANFQIADEIASMNAVDDKTVKIELKFSDINFNGLLAGTSGKIYEKKQAKTAGDKWGSPGVGVECTGPYKLGEWDPATSLTITRNDTYWGPDFKPLAKEVVFTWPQEPTMVKTAFETGELTGGWNVPPSVIAPLQSSGSGQMFVGASDTAVQMYALIVADVKKGNLADPRMRQAISLLIDRNAVASKIYNGAADPLYTLATPGSLTYEKASFDAANKDAASSADPAKAKELAAAAGQANVNLVLALPAGDSLATVTATALQADAKKAGFNITLKPIEPAQYAMLFFDPSARKGVDLFFTIYAPTVRDPIQNYFETIATGQTNNFNGYSNPEVDALIKAGRESTDPAVRAEKAIAVQKIFVADYPYIPIVAPRITVWENASITGAPTTFTWTMSPWAALIGGK